MKEDRVSHLDGEAAHKVTMAGNWHSPLGRRDKGTRSILEMRAVSPVRTTQRMGHVDAAGDQWGRVHLLPQSPTVSPTGAQQRAAHRASS